MLGLMDSHDFVQRNSFAWHPHHEGDMLTNRTPAEEEIEAGYAAYVPESFPRKRGGSSRAEVRRHPQGAGYQLRIRQAPGEWRGEQVSRRD
jgi:hypothetical protein